MADPNFAACMEMIAFVADLLDELESYTSTSSTGLIATAEALRNDLEGDWAQDTRVTIQGVLANVATPLDRDGARALFEPILRQVALVIPTPNPGGSLDDIWRDLYDYCVANSQSINDSEDTYDTSWSAGGSNVGDGEVIRLTVDENGEKLGGWLPDASWTLTCDADARQLGQSHRETWILEGQPGRFDNLDTSLDETGLVDGSLRTLNAGDSTPIVKNPSWNVYTYPGSVLTTLDGWTQVGATLATNLSIDTTNTYRPVPGQTANAALTFDSDETIYQDLVAINGARIDPDTPYLIDVAVRRNGSATGNVTLRLSDTVGSGGVSATIALGDQTADTWVRLRIAVGANCWPKGFNANDLKLQIKADTIAVSTCNVDDLIFVPMQRVGAQGDNKRGRGAMGQYFAILGGQTPFVRDDVFTAADATGGTRGVNHWALSKVAQFGYLPLQTGGTETIADK